MCSHLLQIVERAGGKAELEGRAEGDGGHGGDEAHPHEWVVLLIILQQRLAEGSLLHSYRPLTVKGRAREACGSANGCGGGRGEHSALRLVSRACTAAASAMPRAAFVWFRGPYLRVCRACRPPGFLSACVRSTGLRLMTSIALGNRNGSEVTRLFGWQGAGVQTYNVHRYTPHDIQLVRLNDCTSTTCGGQVSVDFSHS